MKKLRLPWYSWLEARINTVAWVPYGVAIAILAITAALLVAAWLGKPVKTVLTAWLVYLVSP